MSDEIKRLLRGGAATAEPPEKRLKKISDADVARWSRLLIVASREVISTLDRLRIIYRMLDEFSMILWGVAPRDKHVELIRRKCSVEPDRDKSLGEWLLSYTYSEKMNELYMTERLEKLRCIAEAVYAVILDMRV